MLRHRIYYDDGTVAEAAGEALFLARSSGVIAINVEDARVGFYTLVGEHYYVVRNFVVLPVTDAQGFGLFDYLTELGPRKVFLGRCMPNDEFDTIHKMALADKTFGPKSARHPVEDM